MTVREILLLAASMLDMEDVRLSLESAGEADGEGAALLNAFHLVENEIALDYFPLKKKEHLPFEDGKLLFTRFSRLPVNIHSVKCNGQKVRFAIFPAYLQADCAEADILYSYAPERKTLTDECELGGNISARLVALGVASEYCLTKGMFEAAKMWALRYRDALRAAGILRRPLSVRSRRWV